MSHPDTERETSGLTNLELRRAIQRPGFPRVDPTTAIRSLLGRERARPVEAARLILERVSDSDDKIAAIHALGKVRQPEAQAMLFEQLRSQDVHVLRASIWALAKTGDKEALERLQQVPDRQPALKQSLLAARRLLAFRLGVKGFGFEESELPKLEDPPQEKLREMKIQEVEGDRLRRFEAKIRAEAPGLDLRIGPATEINCLGKPLWVVPSRMTAEEPERLTENPAVPMAIFAYDFCTDAPYLKAYVMSEPIRGGAAFYVTRLRGQVTHRGEAKINGPSLKFSLQALRTRFDPAAAMEGELDRAGVLKVTRAVVSESFERQLALRGKPKESKEAPRPDRQELRDDR